MRQTDSNGAVTPPCRGLEAFEQAQVTPVLLLLVKEGIFEGERLLCQLLVPVAPGCACEPGQGPADTGYAMCETAHPLRREDIGPVSISVPMFSALVQQIAKLRSDAHVSLISCLASQHQQGNDGACASGKQIVDVVHCSRCGNLVRQFAGALQPIATVQLPMGQHNVGPDLRPKPEIRAG